MTITVLSKAIPDGGAVYYEDAWRDVIEFHLPLISSTGNNTTIPVVDSDTIKYQFDFFGLLQEYGIPVWLHWITMRLNGLGAPTEYDGSLRTLVIPDNQMVKQILAVYQASKQQVKNIA